MLYHCYNCHKYAFETSCPSCTDSLAEDYVPLDPKYYPEFQYKTQGAVKDFLFKKQEQQQLNQKLDSVLTKYNRFKHPYFVNYLHIAKGTYNTGGVNASSGEYTPSSLRLFQLVLTRLGFNELNEYDQLTIKLIRSTEFNFDYANFVSQVKYHVKEDIRQAIYSWIGEVGSRYRQELPLFIYYLWDSQTFIDDISFNDPKISPAGTPLASQALIKKIRERCEEIYLDIQVTRFKKTLENFDPNNYLNIYKIDSMTGFEFEDFLVRLFSTLGYDVEETRKVKDQGADLFVSRFGKKVVIQAKNYKDSVGNAAVQQVLSAKAFFNCDEAMVITNNHFTPSAIELAEKTGVKLLDREELEKFIDEYNQRIIESLNEPEIGAIQPSSANGDELT